MSLKSKVSGLKSPKFEDSSQASQRKARTTLGIRPRASDFPFVLVNMAMTADGKIATANRKVASFGSEHDHEQLLELRATADAVMSGARTVDTMKVNLGPGGAKFRRRRRQRGLAEYNVRVLVSGNGSINPQAEVFKHRFSPIIILTTQQTAAAKLNQLRALADEVRVCGKTKINFRGALRWLHAQWGVDRLLCEGGGELNAALFQAGFVTEMNSPLRCARGLRTRGIFS
jgi:2,5-diamino-6-(ribosylamino)-4(3H)-pyrimidinone 5'-phosphate reductase